MDVKTKKISEIEIELNITFDYSEVDSLADKKLQDLSKDADLKGFRKGKVPISVLKSKYYSSCQYEALTDRINENYVQALIQQKINPVNKPEIKPSPNKDKVLGGVIAERHTSVGTTLAYLQLLIQPINNVRPSEDGIFDQVTHA